MAKERDYSPELLFSHEALAYWKELEKNTWERVRKLVKERALSQNRTIITREDIDACIPQAIKQSGCIT